LKAKQRIDSFFPKPSKPAIEPLAVLAPEVSGIKKFAIHISREGTDLIYTTVHEQKLQPELTRPAEPKPPEIQRPVEQEDRWALEAKKWFVFRSSF
jgi:hypothetical protein